MSYGMNKTHDAALRSWVESANDPGTDFPIQNLPFGVYRIKGAEEAPAVGIAIGDRILDVGACREAKLLSGLSYTAAISCGVPSLNSLMGLGPKYWSALRHRVSELLDADGSVDDRARDIVRGALVPMSSTEMLLPAAVGDYTDFYASVYHATNVGSMFRPDNPLLQNYKYVPIAYHGRASSLCVSGTPIKRPKGQTRSDESAPPRFGASRHLDFELEVGFFVGPGNTLGNPISIEEAEDHIFGLCVVNDWSARDMQRWEYQPLGPFLAKSFATTISPWIVTLEALEPFRVPAFERPAADPTPLDYLDDSENRTRGGIDLTLEVFVSTRAMREEGIPPFKVSRGSFSDMYWTIAQMLTHHSSNGCNLRPADLMASGTVSGETKSSRGCLLELTWRGEDPIRFPNAEERRFLEDGDEVIMRGYCERDGFVRIGFGECRGTIVA
ncbi:MAG: fumarylacetoacetase [bacterium]